MNVKKSRGAWWGEGALAVSVFEADDLENDESVLEEAAFMEGYYGDIENKGVEDDEYDNW